MGFRFEVSGGQINFNITEFGVIRGCEFEYSVPDSKYAKGHKDNRALIVKGSIARTLSEHPDVLEQVRKWAKIQYKDRDTYYHRAKITVFHGDTEVREITFPDSFVKGFKEEIDPHTGDGIYTLMLMQKLDKCIDIVIEPFNEKHKSLSQLMKESSQRRKAADEERVALIASLVALSLMDDTPTRSGDQKDALSNTEAAVIVYEKDGSRPYARHGSEMLPAERSGSTLFIESQTILGIADLLEIRNRGSGANAYNFERSGSRNATNLRTSLNVTTNRQSLNAFMA